MKLAVSEEQRELRDSVRRFLADLDALAEVICRLGDAAAALDGSLRALEVNPLWVDGDQVEALDVLIVTADRSKEQP